MKKTGFTLSEVLITLVIIGVIAAITVPTLMNNTNGQEYRSAIKKAISGLNQAIALNFSLEGLTAQDYNTSEEIVQNLFKKRMNDIKMPSDSEFTNEVCQESENSLFTTTDGIIFCVTNYKSDNSDEPYSKCDFNNNTPCIESDGPNIWIDVNGVKKPNKVTTSSNKPRDIYQAQIYAQKVVPYGAPTQGVIFEKEVYVGDSQASEDGTNPTPPDNPTPNPTPPEPPNEEDFDFNDENPDEDNPYYDMYDPNKWPSWQDFLRWLWNWLMGLIT